MTSNKIKTTILSAGICLLTLTVSAFGQKPTPTPTPAPTDQDYTVSSSVELGVRGLSVNGNNEKFRSDQNYKPGLRLFDSSFLMDAKHNGAFDHMFFQSSGWGSDPSGFFRGNLDKAGLYKFTSTVRQNRYYNNLDNFTPTWSKAISIGGQHQFNTVRKLGDFDLTILPDSEKLRLKFGYSYNRNAGPGMFSMRWPSFSSYTGSSIRGEEYNVLTKWNNKADDLRAGVEGRILGFNVGLNYGYREFHDGNLFYIPTTNTGNDPALTSSFNTFYNRNYKSVGDTHYLNFFLQRTFAEKFDLTGRVIYSVANTNVYESDLGVGATNTSPITASTILIDADTIGVTGHAKRPQTRADVGFTYRATQKFRISNTFSFDQFNGSGGNLFLEDIASRTGLGVARAADHGYKSDWRTTSYHKYTNYVEADFDLTRKAGFNIGYKYTHRRETLGSVAISPTGAVTVSPEEGQNHTHAFIAGMRLRPTKYWGLFLDGEIGQSDNVFTRAENNDYKFFRVRSIARFSKWTLNISGIFRDNKNPGFSEDILGTVNSVPNVVIFPAQQADANYRLANISTSLDWAPNDKWSFSAGHTYDHQTSQVAAIVYIGAPINNSSTFCVSTTANPTNPCWKVGNSQYFVRDNFFYFDVTAHPVNRVTFYASYRIDNDSGQGSRRITRPEDMIYSYPMRFQTPEVKLSFKISRNIDWDLGYRYTAYRENVPYTPFAYATSTFPVSATTLVPVFPAQNYWAHMPYTSLRIYFGRSADVRR